MQPKAQGASLVSQSRSVTLSSKRCSYVAWAMHLVKQPAYMILSCRQLFHCRFKQKGRWPQCYCGCSAATAGTIQLDAAATTGTILPDELPLQDAVDSRDDSCYMQQHTAHQAVFHTGCCGSKQRPMSTCMGERIRAGSGEFWKSAAGLVWTAGCCITVAAPLLAAPALQLAFP